MEICTSWNYCHHTCNYLHSTYFILYFMAFPSRMYHVIIVERLYSVPNTHSCMQHNKECYGVFAMKSYLSVGWIIYFGMSFLKPQSHYSDNQSPTSRSRQPSATISNQFPTKILVLNRSPTVCRPIADCLPTGRRVVDNQLPITRRLIIEHTSHFGTWSATIWRVIADWSPTVWRDVICIIFWITLPSKEIPTFLRPYVDSFMNTCWNFFWNEGDTIDYVNQLQQPVADQSPTNLELLFLYFSIICIFQDQMYIHFVWQPCLVVDGCWCCIENLWPTKTARRSLTTICRPSKTPRKKGGCRRSARGCRCNSLTTSHRSSTNICRTSDNLRQPPQK